MPLLTCATPPYIHGNVRVIRRLIDDDRWIVGHHDHSGHRVVRQDEELRDRPTPSLCHNMIRPVVVQTVPGVRRHGGA